MLRRPNTEDCGSVVKPNWTNKKIGSKAAEKKIRAKAVEEIRAIISDIALMSELPKPTKKEDRQKKLKLIVRKSAWKL